MCTHSDFILYEAANRDKRANSFISKMKEEYSKFCSLQGFKESQSMLSCKGPVGITVSKFWLPTEPPKIQTLCLIVQAVIGQH